MPTRPTHISPALFQPPRRCLTQSPICGVCCRKMPPSWGSPRGTQRTAGDGLASGPSGSPGILRMRRCSGKWIPRGAGHPDGKADFWCDPLKASISPPFMRPCCWFSNGVIFKKILTHFCHAGSLLHMAFSSCEWELLSGCGAGASCHDGFSPYGARAVGHAGFNVALCRLSWPVARGIFRDQGPKLCPLHMPRWIPNHWTTREALKWSDFAPQGIFGNVWTQLYCYALD